MFNTTKYAALFGNQPFIMNVPQCTHTKNGIPCQVCLPATLRKQA
ncbi:hypothetical protein [Herbaspirillum sp.]|nr:hypothetical protein [Herbaspirillum sp.]